MQRITRTMEEQITNAYEATYEMNWLDGYSSVFNEDQATELVSLTDFSPRKNEALERGYLMGRYGGIPFLNHTLGVRH